MASNIQLKDRMITAETMQHAMESFVPVIPPGTYVTPSAMEEAIDEAIEEATESCVKQDSDGEAWVRSIFTDADEEEY